MDILEILRVKIQYWMQLLPMLNFYFSEDVQLQLGHSCLILTIGINSCIKKSMKCLPFLSFRNLEEKKPM
jgi:hypothetical protein